MSPPPSFSISFNRENVITQQNGMVGVFSNNSGFVNSVKQIYYLVLYLFSVILNLKKYKINYESLIIVFIMFGCWGG